MNNLRVAFYPGLNRMLDNPYWRILRTALEECGVEEAVDAGFGRRWLAENRGKVDVLHFHYIQDFYAFETIHARLRWVLRLGLNLLYARQAGFRTVLTMHNLTPTRPLNPAWVDLLGHWIAVNTVDSLIVHSPSARAAVSRKYGRAKSIFQVDHPNYISIYPNAISPQAARQRLALPPEARCFLFFGGIRPNKGVKELLLAFRQLPDERARLLLVGKPWPPFEYADEIARLAQDDPRVILVPKFIPEDEIQLYMNAADIVVLPFTEILTSGSLMLAMGFGKAVLVPKMGGLPDLVQDGAGLLYPPGEAGLLRGLENALEVDPRAMGEKALSRVTVFTPQRFARQTLAAYHLTESREA